jgi:hypothetical protein
MSDATTAAPAAAPTPDPATAAPAVAPATAPAAAPAAAPATAPAAADAPIQYADFTAPEGVQLDEPVMGEFKTLAQGLKLPQDKAQELVNLGGQVAKASADKFSNELKSQTEAFYADIGGMPDKWAETARADKEFGGDKFDENMAVAKAALDQFGTPELTAFLKKTQAESHPEVLRTFFRIGKAISQDGFVPGRSGASPSAQSMYANSKMNP